MDGQPNIQLQQQIPPNQQVEQAVGLQAQQSPQLYLQARSSFVVKVYSIVALQLLITTIFVIITVTHPKLADFQVKHSVLALLSSFIMLGAMMAILCNKALSQRFPANVVVLTIFTLAQSYVVSSICAIYDQKSVILAAGVTAASTIGITLYVKFTRSDLSTFRSILAGIGSSLMLAIMFVSFATFFVQIPIGTGLISLGLAILYPLYLIYDTQMIMDNIKHKISLDQYVLASMFLYVDIIGIFLDVLRLVGNRRA